MKKILTLAFSLLIPGSIFALPLGNPIDATLLSEGIFDDCFCKPEGCLFPTSYRLGFYGDYVYNRHLKVDNSSAGGSLHEVELNTNAALFALSWCDRFEAFATVGASNIWIFTSVDSFHIPPPTDFMFIDSETSLSWSVGGRATLWGCGCFNLGVEGQYFRANPLINYAQDEGASPVYQDDGTTLTYTEWQVGLGLSYYHALTCCGTALVPYVGISYSDARLDTNNFVYEDEVPPRSLPIPSLDSDRHVGYGLGLTLVGNDMISVTVEGRFVSEKALHLNAQFSF